MFKPTGMATALGGGRPLPRCLRCDPTRSFVGAGEPAGSEVAEELELHVLPASARGEFVEGRRAQAPHCSPGYLSDPRPATALRLAWPASGSVRSAPDGQRNGAHVPTIGGNNFQSQNTGKADPCQTLHSFRRRGLRIHTMNPGYYRFNIL